MKKGLKIKPSKGLIKLFRTVFFFTLLVLGFMFFFEPVRVDGPSMNPTLSQNDYLIILKPLNKSTTLTQGKIVVFRRQGELSIKRVKSVTEDGSVEVLGDNSKQSFDSRDYGEIKINEVVGIAVMRFWPWQKWSLL